MSRQPCGQLTSSTLELRAQLNLTNDQKRRVTIPASMSWSLTWSCDILQVVEHRTWAKLEKELLSRLKSTNPWDLDEMVTPGTAASSFNIHPTDVWNTEKKAGNSLYLNELLIQKCKFSHQVVASTLCLDKHSPKGSCHLDESSLNHTLAQNHLCEFWCGMHRTCKNTSVKPDRSSWKTRSEKRFEGNLSTSLLDESNNSDAALMWNASYVQKHFSKTWQE